MKSLNGATVTVDMDTVCLGQNCKVRFHLDEEEGVSFDLKTGEVLADIGSTPAALQLGDSRTRLQKQHFPLTQR